jgi:trehalose-phosphatase
MSSDLAAKLRSGAIDEELRAAVRRIARTPHLLVACDYDGTLAPIVDDPTRAAPLPEAVAAIRSLAALPQTTVAVISGRALRDLAALSRLPAEVHLIGSHGSEFDVGFVERITPELTDLRTRLGREVWTIAHNKPKVRLEQKPASVAVHTRGADRDVAAGVVEALRSGPATWPDVYVTFGKEVVELAVVATNKGTAIDELRTQQSATAVIFLGDDVTDENAFATLQGPDIGIKIGCGEETRANYCVDDPETGVRVLAFLTESRRRWLFGEQAVPIERHTIISNGNTLALLTPSATVSWLCHPRSDSTPVFAAMLGDDSAGYFSVEPARTGRPGESLPLGQRYRYGTMTAETRWSGLTVCDWLDGEEGENTLFRMLSGSVPVRVSFAPRHEFGQVVNQLEQVGDELRVYGSNVPIRLVAPGVTWEIIEDGGHHTAHAVIDLARMGGTVTLQLRLGGDGSDDEATLADPTTINERQYRSEQPWRDWTAKLRLPSMARNLVLRSALTLRALVYQPTGAIIAAGTTSLPEEMGGLRNWDYRYCWLRDAAMSAQSLVLLGSGAEAEALLAWTSRIIVGTAGHPERLHPLYTVDGFELGAEAVIETLPGYAGSRPVRVGNAANRQVQLDVFGPIADLIAHYADLRGGLDDSHFELMGNMVEAVSRRWHEPDHGIWEARIPPRHHIYSKVMGWLTVDRALRLGQRHGMPVQPEWADLRDEIAKDVLTKGWNEEAGAYTVAYDHPENDASSLWIGLSGLLADDDPRFLATVLAVEAELRSGPIVYRYRWDDGLPGKEGGFHICSAWLVEAYLRTGRRADAEELFGQMMDCAGPTGLLPEQYDPVSERGLGNHPQAYSHLGLINCALLLDRP